MELGRVIKIVIWEEEDDDDGELIPVEIPEKPELIPVEIPEKEEVTEEK